MSKEFCTSKGAEYYDYTTY